MAMIFPFGRMSTAITQYPSGRFGLVGSVPLELTRPQTIGTPQIPPARTSMVWDTEADVIAALLGIGCTKFQLADCSWYDPTAEAEARGRADRESGHEADPPLQTADRAAYLKGYRAAERAIQDATVEECAETLQAMAHVLEQSPEIADVPFALTARPAAARAKQPSLF